MAVVDNAKIILGIEDESKDSLLSLYLDMIDDELQAYCGTSTVSDNLKTQMLVEKYNRRGTESITGFSYSGVGETFRDAYSPQIWAQLASYKRLKSL